MKTNEDFQSFWTGFRNAIISLDYVKLVELTSFPFEAHGRTDEEPKFLIHQDRFYYFLRKCLNEESGMKTDGESNLDFIKRTFVLVKGKNYSVTENGYRVGAMEFQKISNSWKLTRIYFDTAGY